VTRQRRGAHAPRHQEMPATSSLDARPLPPKRQSQRCRAAQQAISFPSTFMCAICFKDLALVNVLGPDRPELARFGPFRTVSPFVRGSPDHSNNVKIPGTCVQYPGLQGGGALGNASTPGTPADSIAASAHGGAYSHVTVAGETWVRERGAAASTAAAAARRRRTTPTGGAFTPPRSAPLTAPVDGRPTGRRNRSRRAGMIPHGSSRARSTVVVAARGRRAQLGAVGSGRGAGTVWAL